ncbi:MAG TPA: hypothetical protein VEH06_04360, partial [Candidatus Bathyarchaeia archaeon]|nr:hypothetical protein [Candidatus Bathyarchaeia archaeon]
MTIVAFSVIIAALVALLVVGAEDIGSGHTVFANRSISGHGKFTNKGINVQTETNQDQGCEGAGGTSGITNACTATSGRGSSQTSTQTSTQTQETFTRANCSINDETSATCNPSSGPSISCTGNVFPGNTATCTTKPPLPVGTQLTCGFQSVNDYNVDTLTCTLTTTHTNTHTVPGT